MLKILKYSADALLGIVILAALLLFFNYDSAFAPSVYGYEVILASALILCLIFLIPDYLHRNTFKTNRKLHNYINLFILTPIACYYITFAVTGFIANNFTKVTASTATATVVSHNYNHFRTGIVSTDDYSLDINNTHKTQTINGHNPNFLKMNAGDPIVIKYRQSKYGTNITSVFDQKNNKVVPIKHLPGISSSKEKLIINKIKKYYSRGC